MSNVEVEVRGELNREQYQSLLAVLDKEGQFQEKKERLFIDFTALVSAEELAKRQLDVRARITNGEPEMVIKVGLWQGSGSRKEIAVKLQKGEFSNLVNAYAALGYTRGIMGERKSVVYLYKDIEFALVEVPGHSYYFEVEILVTENQNAEKTLEYLKQQCLELGLQIFSDQGFSEYIQRLNKEANKIFDIEKDGEKYFEDLESI